jgi:hypothetical protein
LATVFTSSGQHSNGQTPHIGRLGKYRYLPAPAGGFGFAGKRIATMPLPPVLSKDFRGSGEGEAGQFITARQAV